MLYDILGVFFEKKVRTAHTVGMYKKKVFLCIIQSSTRRGG